MADIYGLASFCWSQQHTTNMDYLLFAITNLVNTSNDAGLQLGKPPICTSGITDHVNRSSTQPCWLAGGDTFLQICLWEAGHAITSPGAGFYDWQMRSFDAGSEDRMGLVDYIMRAIEGTCHDRGLCNVRPHMTVKKAVKTHTHSYCVHKQVLCTKVCHVFVALECQTGALCNVRLQMTVKPGCQGVELTTSYCAPMYNMSFLHLSVRLGVCGLC